jgi:hypothetical protein
LKISPPLGPPIFSIPIGNHTLKKPPHKIKKNHEKEKLKPWKNYKRKKNK